MASHHSISVYGYNTAMLSESSPGAPEEQYSPEPPSYHHLGKNSNSCPLLDLLPLELRQQILNYVLPGTTVHKGKGIVWLRGHTAILAANKLLYREGIHTLYGKNTFVVDVNYDGINFAYQWLLPSGLCPTRHNFAFPGVLAERVTSQIRYVNVRVHHIDNYTGMVKYGFEGPGLRDGLRVQVEKFCSTLQGMYQICRLHIHFRNDNHTPEADQQILRLFLALKNVRVVEAAGAVDENFAKMIESRLTNVYERNSFFRLPIELRERVYDIILPYTQKLISSHPTQHPYQRWRHGEVAIMYTCSQLGAEVSSFLYRKNNFQLTCGDDHFRFTPYWLPKGRILPGLPFPQSIGTTNLAQIRHFTIYMPVWWGRTDEEGRQRRRTMLESLGRLLKTIPRITSLTLVCFCSNLAEEWYEEAMHEILSLRGVGKMEIHGHDRDMAKRFREQVQGEVISNDLGGSRYNFLFMTELAMSKHL